MKAVAGRRRGGATAWRRPLRTPAGGGYRTRCSDGIRMSAAARAKDCRRAHQGEQRQLGLSDPVVGWPPRIEGLDDVQRSRWPGSRRSRRSGGAGRPRRRSPALSASGAGRPPLGPDLDGPALGPTAVGFQALGAAQHVGEAGTEVTAGDDDSAARLCSGRREARDVHWRSGLPSGRGHGALPLGQVGSNWSSSAARATRRASVRPTSPDVR